MTWRSPEWLWALLGLPLVATALALWLRDRRRAARAYADPRLLDVSPRRRAWALQIAAATLVVLAIGSGVVALARPAVDHTAHEKRSAVVLAIDTSRSMLTGDLQPTRLGAAVAAAKRFLAVTPKDTAVGLVTFANGATVQTPPVTDRALVAQKLDHLPIRVGTAIGDGVVTSLGALQSAGAIDAGPSASSSPSAARILLLTDGANSAGTDPVAAGERARALRVPIYTVLLGNDPGRPDRASPAETLSGLSNQTGGIYTQSTSTDDLKRVFEDIGSTLAPVRRLDDLAVYAALASFGLLCLAGLCVALATRPRLSGRRQAART